MFLEDFGKLGGDEGEAAALRIYAHVSRNKGELKYAVTRLTRGLQSNKIPIRTGSYSALSALLKLNQLQPTQLREFMQSVLVTSKENTKGERRLVYIARILAYGALLRNVPLQKILSDEQSLLQDVLTELIELCQRRQALLELVSPFIVQLINSESMTQEVFDTHIWPALQPVFVKSEVKAEDDEEEESGSPVSGPLLHVALSCELKGVKTDFEVLKSMDSIVEAFLTSKAAASVASTLMEYLKKTDQAEEFWDALVPLIRSSHFDLLHSCVENAFKAKIHQGVFVKKEIFMPFLAVLKDKENAEQHKKAVSTMGVFLNWSNDEGEEMNKKMRKKVMKVLFGDSPNILHEYQTLVRLLNAFLANACSTHDLEVLETIVDKHLDNEVSIRMGVVYLQFLAKIAQSKQCPADVVMKVSQKLLNGALGLWNLKVKKEKQGSEKAENSSKENKKEKEVDSTMFQKLCADAFQSILASNFNAEFMEGLFQFISDSKNKIVKSDEHKKLIKKVSKLSSKVEDVYLRYLLQAYTVRLVVEQNNVLGEAKDALEEAISLCDSKNKDEAVSSVVKFLLNTSCRETQPPFNYDRMFARLVIEDKISSDCVQIFAETIDAEVNDVANLDDEDSEDDSDDDGGDEKENVRNDEVPESDEEEPKSESVPKSRLAKGKTSPAEENDSDSSIDMDEATEEDLSSMDAALAKVFAAKKKAKEEENSKFRSLMRTFKMLESFLTRKTKKCDASVPLLLLVPLIHSLQNAMRAVKKGQDLSHRIVCVLKKLNGIKKFEDVDSVETGSLLTMAKDISEIVKHTKNQVISHLLGESLVTLTRCYLLKKDKTHGESEGFMCLYNSLLEAPKEKQSKRTELISKVIFSALATVPGWVEEKPKVGKTQDTKSKSDQLQLRNEHLLSMLRSELPTSDSIPESKSPKDSKKKSKKRKTAELPEEQPVEVVGRITRSKKSKMI